MVFNNTYGKIRNIFEWMMILKQTNHPYSEYVIFYITRYESVLE